MLSGCAVFRKYHCFSHEHVSQLGDAIIVDADQQTWVADDVTADAYQRALDCYEAALAMEKRPLSLYPNMLRSKPWFSALMGLVKQEQQQAKPQSKPAGKTAPRRTTAAAAAPKRTPVPAKKTARPTSGINVDFVSRC